VLYEGDIASVVWPDVSEVVDSSNNASFGPVRASIPLQLIPALVGEVWSGEPIASHANLTVKLTDRCKHFC
jgi:hypothetical protein